jgi:hypothetical protein
MNPLKDKYKQLALTEKNFAINGKIVGKFQILMAGLKKFGKNTRSKLYANEL